jgi:hypothetical protein
MKKSILIFLVSCFLISCNTKKKENLNKLLNENNKLLSRIDSLQKKTDSLRLQLKKCDNWITYLESE